MKDTFRRTIFDDVKYGPLEFLTDSWETYSKMWFVQTDGSYHIEWYTPLMLGRKIHMGKLYMLSLIVVESCPRFSPHQSTLMSSKNLP